LHAVRLHVGMSLHLETGAVSLVALGILVWVTWKYLRGDVDVWLEDSVIAGPAGDAETAMNILVASTLAVAALAVAVWQWQYPNVRWAFLVGAGTMATLAFGAASDRT
jgi:hypothetical protein